MSDAIPVAVLVVESNIAMEPLVSERIPVDTRSDFIAVKT